MLTLFKTAQGHGAKGDNEYQFTLEFLEPVLPKVASLLCLKSIFD